MASLLKKIIRKSRNRIFFYILIGEFVLIAAGTLVSFALGKTPLYKDSKRRYADSENVVGFAAPPDAAPSGGADAAPDGGANANGIKTFGGIGRLRAPLETESGTALIEPYFMYNSGDRAFSEELATHVKDFRAATLDYFAAFPASSPILNDDGAIKKELLKRYNAFLKLDKIDELYFTNFMVLD
jgi:flagellar basal body-associated protein FliL